MVFRSPFPDIIIPEVPLTPYIFQHVQERADKPALIDGPSGRTLTYGQLTGAIQRAAAGLAASGYRKGEVFAIYCPNMPEYAVVFHAVLVLGGTVTTVNPLYTVRELAHQLQDADARYLLTVPHLDGELVVDAAALAEAADDLRRVAGPAVGRTAGAAMLTLRLRCFKSLKLSPPCNSRTPAATARPATRWTACSASVRPASRAVRAEEGLPAPLHMGV